jgi:hypothetical protein
MAAAAPSPRRPCRPRGAGRPCRVGRAARHGADRDRSRQGRALPGAQPSSPQDHDQPAQAAAVRVVAGRAHDGDQLFHLGRIGRITQTFVVGDRPAWKPGMVPGDRRRPARSTSSSDMSPPRLVDERRIKRVASDGERRRLCRCPRCRIHDGAAASADLRALSRVPHRRQRMPSRLLLPQRCRDSSQSATPDAPFGAAAAGRYELRRDDSRNNACVESPYPPSSASCSDCLEASAWSASPTRRDFEARRGCLQGAGCPR